MNDKHHLPLAILTRFRTLSGGWREEELMEDTKNVPVVYEGTGALIGSLPAPPTRSGYGSSCAPLSPQKPAEPMPRA